MASSLDVGIDDYDMVAAVLTEEVKCIPIPVWGLCEKDCPPTHLAAFVPLPVRSDDCMRNFLANHHFLGCGQVVRDGICRSLAVVDPAVPSAADHVPVPLAQRVVGGDWLPAVVEVLIAFDTVAVILLWGD